MKLNILKEYEMIPTLHTEDNESIVMITKSMSQGEVKRTVMEYLYKDVEIVTCDERFLDYAHLIGYNSIKIGNMMLTDCDVDLTAKYIDLKELYLNGNLDN